MADNLQPSPNTNDTRARHGSPNISWPVGRPNTPALRDPGQSEIRGSSIRNNAAMFPNTIPAEFERNGRRSLSGIALRAWILGNIFSGSFILSCLALLSDSPLWRPPFFAATLSLFFFLEFMTTAAFNAPKAQVSSFLLRNGNAQDIAFLAAFLECSITSMFFPGWQSRFAHSFLMVAGAILLLVGQFARSAAMVQAGTNFNHQVQTRRNDGHMLVTDGIYGWLRHPSYFGFFWWTIGIQLILGNPICFVLFSFVLFRFFSHRIKGTLPP